VYEKLTLLLVFALGASIGSFLNVVIYRLPRGESIVFPGSRCPKCQHAIPFIANIPVLAWFALRGRCLKCKAPISFRYPLVEALVGALFLGFWLEDPTLPRVVVQWAMAAVLVAIAFIDLDHQIVPNKLTYPGIPLALLASVLLPPPDWISSTPFWVYALAGLVGVGGLLYAVSYFYEKFRGRTGLGMGDVKLVAMMAAYLGLDAAFGVLLLGSALGILNWLVLRAAGKVTAKTRIPFAPALAASGIVHQFDPTLVPRLLGN